VLIKKFQFPNTWIVFKFYLVLKADHVPSIKKYRFLKRKLFITVSNNETMTKTADVRVEGQMANWNQKLEPL